MQHKAEKEIPVLLIVPKSTTTSNKIRKENETERVVLLLAWGKPEGCIHGLGSL